MDTGRALLTSGPVVGIFLMGNVIIPAFTTLNAESIRIPLVATAPAPATKGQVGIILEEDITILAFTTPSADM